MTEVNVETNVTLIPDTKRYIVSANKTMYTSDSYETQEEAIAAAADLVKEGYAFISIRDHETDGDIW